MHLKGLMGQCGRRVDTCRLRACEHTTSYLGRAPYQGRSCQWGLCTVQL